MQSIIREIIALFKPQTEEKEAAEISLRDQIHDIRRRIDAANSRFERETDERLLESTIYELQSLEAKYRYLVSLAREERDGKATA